MKTEEWIEAHIKGLYTFKCVNCGCTKIKRVIVYSYFGPPTDLSYCPKCGWSNWEIIGVKEIQI